ncbi:L-threonylcarbamoyladenylate synthase [Mogibacterium neglectum]|uniref:L-threonylcarbamoyladenylate synthase n=1 Tax=Mogibacterium neglectum TaxID=114528 RepID=UPI00272B38AB|nr:L-threonylcarbamoyladenylate synthase [Mogibacterium neglectum]WLD76231.1 L-threonylcarbamoyladenylate synthase [Mogibacterium neglectum]
MKTRIILPDTDGISEAGAILRAGGLVAFPTETVYGLGANALDATATRRIYEAKGRPSDNPMIVHVASIDMLNSVAWGVSDEQKALMSKLWPGPITFVLRKNAGVPEVTTGGLDTVAVRWPSRREAAEIIVAAGVPIAAPSANLSGKPSPTTFEDVAEDMDGRIDAIVKGERTAIGIESTVLDLTSEVPTILRPGFITKSQIEEAVDGEVQYDPSLFKKPGADDFHPKSPGMKYKHYAPKAAVRIVEGSKDAVCAAIAELEDEALSNNMRTAVLDYMGNGDKAANNFFADLRQCDRDGVDIIYIAAYDWDEVGFSVMNRMVKSAGYDIVNV